MTELKISVAMCTYNGAKYLQAQLGSLCFQTRMPDELIIFDDVSTDETPILIRQFSDNAPFPVRFYRNANNIGSTKNFECAIARSTGDIVVLADQDDVWAAEKLQIIEEEFKSSPLVGLVFSDAELVDQDLKPLSKTMWDSIGFSKEMREQFLNSSALGKVDFFLRRNVVTGATMAFRSKYGGIINPIPDSWVHDAWIATLLSSITDFKILSSPLIKYRQHSQQQIGASRKRIFEKISDLVNKPPDEEYEEVHQAMQSLYDRISQNIELFDVNVANQVKSKLEHSSRRLSLLRKSFS